MDRLKSSPQAKNYFLPFVLGNKRSSRALASRVFRAHGCASFIFDKKSSLGCFFARSYYFVPLSHCSDARLLCEQLIDHARRYPACLPILVPTDGYYREVTEQNRDMLERYFIIREPDTLLTTPPFLTDGN